MSARGRAGELDATAWSAARQRPQLPTAGGQFIGITQATIRGCRGTQPVIAFPDDDTLVCNPNANISSSHLLVAVGAQNYGQNSYRIRQPFDFNGRTGRIVFDAEGYSATSLQGWVSLEVTEDPAPGPSFAIGGDGVRNDEGSVVPRSGFEIQFQNTCNETPDSPKIGIRMLLVFKDYVATGATITDPVCVATKQGNLNHFEVDVAQNHIDVFATDESTDGKSFGTPKLLYGADVNLPFTRGYVHITTHNHATIKYSPNGSVDSWIARWDNVGFDGPVIPYREFSVPDSLTKGVDGAHPIVNVGYHAEDVAKGPADKLTLRAVSLAGAKGARLAFSSWYLYDPGNTAAKVAQYLFKFRLNGGTWRDRPLSAAEQAILQGPNSQGALAQLADVPLTDLVEGDNTLEFVAANVPQNYPPAVFNIDLILDR